MNDTSLRNAGVSVDGFLHGILDSALHCFPAGNERVGGIVDNGTVKVYKCLRAGAPAVDRADIVKAVVVYDIEHIGIVIRRDSLKLERCLIISTDNIAVIKSERLQSKHDIIKSASRDRLRDRYCGGMITVYGVAVIFLCGIVLRNGKHAEIEAHLLAFECGNRGACGVVEKAPALYEHFGKLGKAVGAFVVGRLTDYKLGTLGVLLIGHDIVYLLEGVDGARFKHVYVKIAVFVLADGRHVAAVHHYRRAVGVGKVAVCRIEAPRTVFIGMGDLLAHLVIKINGEIAVANDLVNIAVRRKIGVFCINILIEECEVGVVVIREYGIARQEEVTVAERKHFVRFGIPPRVRKIHFAVQGGIKIVQRADSKPVDRIADDIVFRGAGLYGRHGSFARRFDGNDIEADTVLFAEHIVAHSDSMVDGVAVLFRIVGKLLFAVCMASRFDAENDYFVVRIELFVLVGEFAVIGGAVGKFAVVRRGNGAASGFGNTDVLAAAGTKQRYAKCEENQCGNDTLYRFHKYLRSNGRYRRGTRHFTHAHYSTNAKALQ